MLKIFHDWNNPLFDDSDGRIILVVRTEDKLSLAEGMHILVGDGDVDVEAVLESVPQPTSKGFEDTWRARLLPVANNKTNMEVERIEDFYSIKFRGREDKGRFGRVMTRWEMYLYLRRKLNLSPESVEVLLSEADANWYVEHKRRLDLIRKSGTQSMTKD